MSYSNRLADRSDPIESGSSRSVVHGTGAASREDSMVRFPVLLAGWVAVAVCAVGIGFIVSSFLLKL